MKYSMLFFLIFIFTFYSCGDSRGECKEEYKVDVKKSLTVNFSYSEEDKQKFIKEAYDFILGTWKARFINVSGGEIIEAQYVFEKDPNRDADMHLPVSNEEDKNENAMCSSPFSIIVPVFVSFTSLIESANDLPGFFMFKKQNSENKVFLEEMDRSSLLQNLRSLESKDYNTKSQNFSYEYNGQQYWMEIKKEE